MKDPRKATDAPERLHLRRKRRRLAGLALAVLLPLAVMQVLQYRWLLDLEKQSSIGSRSRMGHYLDGVAKEVAYFYRQDAYSSLAMKPGLLKPDWFHKAPYYFKKNEAMGAQRRFLVNYLAEPGQQLFFFNPETVTFEPARAGEVPDDFSVALAPFSLRALEVGGAHGAGLLVEEWSGRNRLILNPITDEAERLVGVTGYVVDQARIFERFHRVGTGLVHDVKGSGLGLSIVQHVVVAHGGRVRVESEVGEGSTFSFFLPFHKENRAGHSREA